MDTITDAKLLLGLIAHMYGVTVGPVRATLNWPCTDPVRVAVDVDGYTVTGSPEGVCQVIGLAQALRAKWNTPNLVLWLAGAYATLEGDDLGNLCGGRGSDMHDAALRSLGIDPKTAPMEGDTPNYVDIMGLTAREEA